MLDSTYHTIKQSLGAREKCLLGKKIDLSQHYQRGLEVFLEGRSTETNIHVACSRGIAVIPNSNNLFFSIFYKMEREIPETSLGEA